jgi:ABC-type glutathione transport system ATPase component
MLNAAISRISVTKSKRESIILRDIFLELSENSIYTILGKNGSGKSTLLKSLTKLLDERLYSITGSITYNNKNILAMNEPELREIRRKNIKYVFQDPVNSFDHLKNFGYYFSTLVEPFVSAEIEELLDFFLLPEKDILFKMHPYEVSGGMAQRICFILALLAKPKIILLDEPTSGIDAPIVNLLLIKLKDYVKDGHAALLVTQDIQLAKSASDKVAMLSNGTLTDFSEPEEIFNLNNSVSEILAWF